MEIGKLNQRITILEQSTKIDNIGNHKAQWEELFSCWAAVVVKASSENAETGVTKELQSMEFTIRQTPQTISLSTSAHRIQFRGVIYNIDSILPNFRYLDYMKIVAHIRRSGENDEFS